MKRLLFSMFVFVLATTSFGQNYIYDNIISSNDTVFCAPDSIQLYGAGSSCLYSVDTIPYSPYSVGGTSPTMYDDSYTGSISLGFTFDFYCNSYTSLYISSNGWVSFTPITAASGWAWNYTPNVTTDVIPSTTTNVPKNCVMGPWKDWTPSGSGYIYYQMQGTAPFRRFIISWSSVPMYACTSTQFGTFQIVLYETTNVIENYLTNAPYCSNWQSPNPGWGTQAIHDINGTDAEICNSRNANTWTATNEGWTYAPAGIVWVWQGDTVGEGNVLNVTPNGFYPQTCDYLYAYVDSLNGNIAFDSILISPLCEPPTFTSIDVQCTGDSTGQLVAEDTSNQTSGPWVFKWYDDNNNLLKTTTSSNPIDTIVDLASGLYHVEITDTGQACFAIYGSEYVNEPDTVNAYIQMTPVLCNGDATGEVYAEDTNNYSSITSWDGLYSFYWTKNGNAYDSTVFTNSSSNTVSNVTVGVYNVTIDGCLIQTGSITVTEPPVLVATIGNETPVSCPGTTNCDASAQGSAVGGVPPYYYSWSSGENNQIASQLCADTNFLYVFDANGCSDTTYVVIEVPDPIVTTAFGDTMICITNPATIAAASTGGTPPFSYVWREAAMNGVVVSTNANHTVHPEVTTQYFVSSTDANGCPGDTSEVLIKVRPPLTSEIDDIDTICPYDTIDLFVTGFGGDSIYTYSWSSGVFGNTATVSPDLSVWYTVTVSDQCGTPSYVDSIWVQVGGYSPIDAEIRVEDDSICTGESIYLIASGRGGWRGPEEYQYKWTDNMSNSPIQFVKPTSTKTYTVTITDLCLSVAGVADVTVHVGKPWVPDFDVFPDESCSNEEIKFKLKEFRQGHVYRWEFGDNSSFSEASSDSVFHQYDASGCYDVTLSVTDLFGCFAQRKEVCAVKILQAPTASFLHAPDQPNTMDPYVKFQNTSRNSETVSWYLNSDTLSLQESFVYEFNDTGAYEVMLVAVSEDGCLDTTSKVIHHKVERTLFIPTSFTPNGDGLNDVFRIEGEGIDAATFELRIFDRWGNTVFLSKNPDFGWDGRYLPNDEYVPIGTYAYTLQYTDVDGNIRKIRGQVVISQSGQTRGLR